MIRWPAHRNEGQCPTPIMPTLRDQICRACKLLEAIDALFDAAVDVLGEATSDNRESLEMAVDDVRRLT